MSEQTISEIETVIAEHALAAGKHGFAVIDSMIALYPVTEETSAMRDRLIDRVSKENPEEAFECGLYNDIVQTITETVAISGKEPDAYIDRLTGMYPLTADEEAKIKAEVLKRLEKGVEL